MELIGIAGRKGAGKDTAAEVLVAAGYENVKFAGALKAMMYAFANYVGIEPETAKRLIDGDLKEQPNEHLGGKSFRWAMQTLGTEWGRELIFDGIWIRSFLSRAAMFDKGVCTDMRFPNEVETVKSQGGTTLRVVDPRFKRPAEEHESESQIDTLAVDYVVCNDKKTMSVEDLHATIVSMFGDKFRVQA